MAMVCALGHPVPEHDGRDIDHFSSGAFAADFFGPRNVGSIYGLMLTAWGFAAVCGPTLMAHVRQSTGHYTQALEIMAGIMLLSAVLPFVIRPPDIETQNLLMLLLGKR